MPDWFTSHAPTTGGLLGPGNIDLAHRPRVMNPDGSVSTVRSIGVNIDGREVLIPTVSDDGRVLSDADAVALYKRTGKHLGIYDSVAHSNAAGQRIHEDQAAQGDWFSAHAPKPETQQPVPTEDMKYRHPLARLGYGLVDLVKNHPVETGAAVGGLLAVPLTGGASIPAAMAAAGLGGAGGAGVGIAARQLATGRPEPGLQTVKTMAREGVGQAAGEGIGQAAVPIGNKVIPAVLKGLYRPSARVQAEFPDIIQTIRQEQIPLGSVERATARKSASAAEARGMVADAEAAGAPPVRVREASQDLGSVRDKMALRADLALPDEVPELAGRVKALRAKHPGGIALTRAQDMKTEAQNLAQATYRAIDKGAVVNDTGALTNTGLASGLRKGIEARVPEVASQNARTQSLMGLEDTLVDAERRHGGIVGLNPIHWAGGLMPGVSSTIAFGADADAKAAQAPLARLIRQALLARLAGETDQNP